MAFGKITGSVIQDNTITESNLAFGISGQSAATSWATDTLKVNIIESDDSTSVTVNDGLIVTGNLAFDGGVSVSTILDEDTMSSDSATALATQQSIKAYVDSVAGGTLRILDDTSTTGTIDIAGGDYLIFATTSDITPSVTIDNQVEFRLSETVSATTLSAETLQINTIESTDSSGINIAEAKLYVNGSTVLTVNTADEPAVTTAIGDVDHILINDGGIAKRIALANIDISQFNNDAGYAAGGVSGFTSSTTTSFPTSSDSVARDYGDGEPVGVGTGSAANTDAFGVALGTTYDCMEPNGSITTTDLGTEEAYVGA
jgi:hypothetical protein